MLQFEGNRQSPLSARQSDGGRDGSLLGSALLEQERTFAKVKEANDLAAAVQRQLVAQEMARRQCEYMEQQEAYRQRRSDEQRQRSVERAEQQLVVDQDAEKRRLEEVKAARERQMTTVQRLRVQAQKEAEEHAVELREKRVKLAKQARWQAAHVQKMEVEQRKKVAEQKQIEQERMVEKAETKQCAQHGFADCPTTLAPLPLISFATTAPAPNLLCNHRPCP
jgi:hypothetical protein